MTAREKIRCRHFMDYYFQLAAREVLFAPSHSQDSTESMVFGLLLFLGGGVVLFFKYRTDEFPDY